MLQTSPLEYVIRTRLPLRRAVVDLLLQIRQQDSTGGYRELLRAGSSDDRFEFLCVAAIGEEVHLRSRRPGPVLIPAPFCRQR